MMIRRIYMSYMNENQCYKKSRRQHVPDANGVYAVLKLSKSDSYGFGEL